MFTIAHSLHKPVPVTIMFLKFKYAEKLIAKPKWKCYRYQKVKKLKHQALV